jgi:DNA polymerase I-like protein with 3'-5' exonuclease and polymerase domains
MTIFKTHEITPLTPLSQSENLQVYCGLDSCVTLEVLGELERTHSAPAIYSFERALQGPYLEIMLRGFAVDQLARRHAAEGLRHRLAKLDSTLQAIAEAVWGKMLNPRSPQQLREFFYSTMKLPEVWLSQKGERKLSTNREALEKLDVYLYARPVVACILAIRDVAKQLEMLETEIDPDGRFRTSYNIAGTETGRPSSSSNAYGTGGNAQNTIPTLRYVYVSDPGWKLAVIDLEQVEARDVGWFCGTLFDDWSFLDACESGDLHTNNAKKVWPELGWPNTPAGDRAIADQLYYRESSYRYICKRLGHLLDYMGTAWTASRVMHVPIGIVEDFYSRYATGPNAAYPCIPRYWQWIAQQLQTQGSITTPFGRKRHFFGRPGDDTTLREAIAFLPQSTTADRMSLGMWRVWKKMPQIQLLAETYDSITFQYRESVDEDEIIAEALAHVRVEFACASRKYVVPAEAKVGFNWGDASPVNPLGLVKWKQGKKDLRTRQHGLKRMMQ